MSEIINNQAYRQQVIKEIINELHQGKSVEELKEKFAAAFKDVSASELSQAEGALIAEGLPVSEVQKLCDVHAAVFGGSIEQIHQSDDPTLIVGHPLNYLVRENLALQRLLDQTIKPLIGTNDNEDLIKLQDNLARLSKIDIHYAKKENLYFPLMEKYGISAPPKVMWGVDDEIREKIKACQKVLSVNLHDRDLPLMVKTVVEQIESMITKEEQIMIPMVLEHFTDDDWQVIAHGSEEFGYLVKRVNDWQPVATAKPEVKTIPEEGLVKLPSGEFTIEQLTTVLNALPFDITFVDHNDEVRFFSETKDRVFPRPRAIIGRNVSNCHPPKSVHIVQGIVEDFKAGKKDNEDFWIKMGEKLVLIRYFAVRNPEGDYLGVLEVTQEISGIQQLTGEKRLVA